MSLQHFKDVLHEQLNTFSGREGFIDDRTLKCSILLSLIKFKVASKTVVWQLRILVQFPYQHLKKNLEQMEIWPGLPYWQLPEKC